MSSLSGNTKEGSNETPVVRVRSWVLLDGPRKVVAGITTGGLFLFILAVSLSRFSPLSDLQPLYYVFGGLIGGNITIVTVVVSINQLLLSYELSTPDELRSEIEGMIDYRRDVEDSAGQVAPVEPLGFLRLVFETTRQRAQQVGGLAVTEADEDLSDEINQVVTKITRHADRVDGLLQEGNIGTFQVLSTTLNTNYAREINQLREITSRHDDDLPSDVNDSIKELIHLLQNIDIARQYLKSIYLQQELATLSRLLFYTGLPAVAIVAGAVFVFTVPGGTTVSPLVLTILIPAIISIGFFPLTVLFSYILRTATVAHRTAAIIPFTAPAQEG